MLLMALVNGETIGSFDVHQRRYSCPTLHWKVRTEKECLRMPDQRLPDKDDIYPEMTVHRLLNAYPRLAEVFVAHRMACVGCTLSGFHTLAEAAAIYGIELAVWLSELRDTLNLRSADN